MGRRTLAVLASLVLAGTGLVFVGGTVAGAAPVTVDLDCEASTPIGAQEADQTVTIDTTAPATVVSGDTFTIVSSTPAGTIPSSNGGYTVNSVKDFVLRIPIAANATYVTAWLTGGSGLGAGTPAVAYSGGNIVMTIPGPIAGGASYQFPAIHVTLTASGPDFSTIEPRLGGTSFANPGFELTANVQLPVFGATDVPTDCFPKPPNPALSTTTIIPPDTTAPTPAITTPPDGASYAIGSVVAADYACDDGP